MTGGTIIVLSVIIIIMTIITIILGMRIFSLLNSNIPSHEVVRSYLRNNTNHDADDPISLIEKLDNQISFRRQNGGLGGRSSVYSTAFPPEMILSIPQRYELASRYIQGRGLTYRIVRDAMGVPFLVDSAGRKAVANLTLNSIIRSTYY